MTPVSNTNLSPPGVPPAPAKFFRKDARHATEDITMGKRWKRELERVLVENSLPNLRSASMVLEKQMQKEMWPHGMESIRKLPKREYASLLVTDSPFLDEDGLIKGGGRLAHADLTFGRKHPTLIPDSELGGALIGYLHHNAGHQGRKVSAALIRDEGYSVIGAVGEFKES